MKTNNMKEHQKTALIIGATSGIGRALAECLVKEGYHVCITGRREELLKEIQASSPENYSISCFDNSNTEHTEKAFQEIYKKLPQIEVIIVNAGVSSPNSIFLEAAIATNVKGFTHCCALAYEFFVKQGYGHLVGVSSVAGLRGMRQSPIYSASKAYVIAYLEGLALKAYKEHPAITVTDVRPGFIDTPMTEGKKEVFVSIPSDEAARQIYKVLQSKKRVAYVPKKWSVLAYVLKKIPYMIFKQF